MEKLIKELMQKVVEKEKKTNLFKIYQNLDSLNFESNEEIKTFIENYIDIDDDK